MYKILCNSWYGKQPNALWVVFIGGETNTAVYNNEDIRFEVPNETHPLYLATAGILPENASPLAKRRYNQIISRVFNVAEPENWMYGEFSFGFGGIVGDTFYIPRDTIMKVHAWKI